MILCDKLNKAELVRLGDPRHSGKMTNFKLAKNRIYYPPIIDYPINEHLLQKDAYLFKSLKQLINHTRKKLDPKENWSRLDENIDYYDKDYGRSSNRRRADNSNSNLNKLNLQNSNKKKRKNKNCKCECDKDLIITVPKYKYRDVPLGKEVSSNHLHGNQYEGLPADTQSTFESMQDDHEPNESAQIKGTRIKQQRPVLGKNSIKRFKSRLPDKNLRYFRRNDEKISQSIKLNAKKSPNRRNGKLANFSEKDEYVNTADDEPVDFLYKDESTGDEANYDLNRNDKDEFDDDREQNDREPNDYHQYIDFVSQDTDDVEDYNLEENETEEVVNRKFDYDTSK